MTLTLNGIGLTTQDIRLDRVSTNVLSIKGETQQQANVRPNCLHNLNINSLSSISQCAVYKDLHDVRKTIVHLGIAVKIHKIHI